MCRRQKTCLAIPVLPLQGEIGRGSSGGVFGGLAMRVPSLRAAATGVRCEEDKEDALASRQAGCEGELALTGVGSRCSEGLFLTPLDIVSLGVSGTTSLGNKHVGGVRLPEARGSASSVGIFDSAAKRFRRYAAAVSVATCAVSFKALTVTS